MHDRFMYQKGKKTSVVEFKDEITDGYRVLTYRDLNESAAEQENYLRHMERGDKAYTQEGFDKSRYFMGVTVLQTSMEEKSPKKIYELYKKRWTIETFYYFKNKADFNVLYVDDYYMTQGLAFIMLIVGLIQREMENAVVHVDNGKSVATCLLEVKMLKVSKHRGTWTVCNALSKQKALFEKLNTPLKVLD